MGQDPVRRLRQDKILDKTVHRRLFVRARGKHRQEKDFHHRKTQKQVPRPILRAIGQVQEPVRHRGTDGKRQLRKTLQNAQPLQQKHDRLGRFDFCYVNKRMKCDTALDFILDLFLSKDFIT